MCALGRSWVPVSATCVLGTPMCGPKRVEAISSATAMPACSAAALESAEACTQAWLGGVLTSQGGHHVWGAHLKLPHHL